MRTIQKNTSLLVHVSLLVFVSAAFLLPSLHSTTQLAYAQTESGNVNSSGGNVNSTGGNINPTSPNSSGTLVNPLKATSITEFLVAIVDVLLIFAMPLIVIYIMYAGFRFVTAQGNPGEIETARTALLWAVVGGVIVLGAKLIIEVIDGTIKAFGA